MYSFPRRHAAQAAPSASTEPFWKPKHDRSLHHLQDATGSENEKHAQLVFHGNAVSDRRHGETTIEPPQMMQVDELTTPDGGVAPAPAPAAASFFQCTPTSAAIKNVKKYTSGKLYGHEFDFVVDLTYTKLGAGATKDDDAKLEWWEKTDRPPSWQTTVKKDTWNDMFALYPTSPVFNNWTGRTKPVPGNETVTLHDPPAASVDMPARTLEFNLKVIGGGKTVSATGKQVLEPDGKGGIKTQTFT